jgi:hypothetical protein
LIQVLIVIGNDRCKNKYCRSSSRFKYDEKTIEDRNKVAAEAIRLCSEHVELCVDENMIQENDEFKIKHLTEDNLEKLIHRCKQTNNWDLLRNTIEFIFSNRLNLSTSFLKKDFSQTIPMNKQNSSSATPKSKTLFFMILFSSRDLSGFSIHDPRVTLDNDEITLDFNIMDRSIQLLISYDDEISSVIHKSLDILLNQLRYELQSAKQNDLETDANFFNIFFTIFQLPFLSDPAFIFDIAQLFYSVLTNLSIEAQAKFVRLLAKYTNNLSDYVSHVQQYITLHTLRWENHTNIQSSSEDLLSNEPGE